MTASSTKRLRRSNGSSAAEHGDVRTVAVTGAVSTVAGKSRVEQAWCRSAIDEAGYELVR